MRKSILLFIVSIILIAVISFTSLVYYYVSWPKEFQVNGKFSIRSIRLDGLFDNTYLNSRTLAFESVIENMNARNYTINLDASKDWRVNKLTIISPLGVLLQTNGSLSIKMKNLGLILFNSTIPVLKVWTNGGNKISFVAQAGKSLNIHNVSAVWVEIPRGNITLIFLGSPEEIYVERNGTSWTIRNKGVYIYLEIEVFRNFNMVCSGNLNVLSNSFFFVLLETWTSPVKVNFMYPVGFLSYGRELKQVFGSEDLFLEYFKGAINLSKSVEPHEISVQGRAEKVLIGNEELTAPNPIRDLIQILTLFSGLFSLLLAIFVPASIAVYRDYRNRRNEHLISYKRNLFMKVKENLEGYFEPYIRLRKTGQWVFLRGLTSHNDYPLDINELEKDTDTLLLMDLRNHYPELDSKINTFRKMVEEYNKKFLGLAKIVGEEIVLPPSGIFNLLNLARIGRPDKGGYEEWAFRLLLGAKEEEIQDELYIDEKEDGMKCLQELQNNNEIVKQVELFRELCNNLEMLIRDLIDHLNSLLESNTLPGKCNIIKIF